MTLAELERGFELHEQRMTRLEENLTRLEANLSRLEGSVTLLTGSVTPLEQGLAGVKDNLIVQARLLDRVDQMVMRNTEAIGRLVDNQVLLQSAMDNLFKQMEAFLKGLGRHNGNPQGPQLS